MESYIVRVLRHQQTNQTGEDGAGKDSAVHLDGVVEAVDEGGGYRAFHSVNELWSILTGDDRGNQSKEGKTPNRRR